MERRSSGEGSVARTQPSFQFPFEHNRASPDLRGGGESLVLGSESRSRNLLRKQHERWARRARGLEKSSWSLGCSQDQKAEQGASARTIGPGRIQWHECREDRCLELVYAGTKKNPSEVFESIRPILQLIQLLRQIRPFCADVFTLQDSESSGSSVNSNPCLLFGQKLNFRELHRFDNRFW